MQKTAIWTLHQNRMTATAARYKIAIEKLRKLGISTIDSVAFFFERSIYFTQILQRYWASKPRIIQSIKIGHWSSYHRNLPQHSRDMIQMMYDVMTHWHLRLTYPLCSIYSSDTLAQSHRATTAFSKQNRSFSVFLKGGGGV